MDSYYRLGQSAEQILPKLKHRLGKIGDNGITISLGVDRANGDYSLMEIVARIKNENSSNSAFVKKFLHMDPTCIWTLPFAMGSYFRFIRNIKRATKNL